MDYSYTPNYNDTSWKSKEAGAITIKDLLNQGFNFADAFRLIGGPNHDNGANYVKYYGSADAAAQAMNIQKNTSGTPHTIYAKDLPKGYDQASLYSIFTDHPVDTNKAYSWDANGNPIYENSNNQQSGTQQTQTYTMNGKTYTTAPGGSVPVGGTKVSDSTGNYQQVAQNTPAAPLDPNDPTYKAYLASHPNLTSTLPSATSATAQTGGTSSNSNFTLTGNNLKLYSSGDDVKKLQTYLAGVGLYQGKVDGIFGPQTQQSVQQFQSIHGLTPDGVVGPKTISAIQSIQSGSSAPTNTQSGYKAPDDPSNQFNTTTGQPNPNYNSGSNTSTQPKTDSHFGLSDAEWSALPQTQQATLTALGGFVNQQSQLGNTVNPDLSIGQDEVNKFLEQAKNELHPYYAQQIAGVQQDVVRNAGAMAQLYQNQVGDTTANYQNNLGSARESYAGNGLAFSGQRGQGEQNMQNSTNRSLSNLSSQYNNNLIDLGRSAEQKIGASNVNYSLPGLSSYYADLNGNRGNITQGSSLGGYSPGTYQSGSIPKDELTATTNQGLDYINQANKLKTQGLSYASLFH